MTDGYLNRILEIIAELRKLLKDSDLPEDRAAGIEATLSRMEQIVEQYK